MTKGANILMLFKCNLAARYSSAVLIALLTACSFMSGQTERKLTELAAGVYEIDHGQGGGNTTVIIGERQVLVVDSCFLPSAARQDIAQIRQWTDKPVSFVVNTHFHNDHNIGNRAYMDAFPAVTIIAHMQTKKDMDMFGPGSASREARSAARLQRMLDSNKAPDGTALTTDDQADVRNALERQNRIIEELKNLTFQSATLTFDHDFAIDLGNREVEIKFLGRGNTSGDAVVYLPQEKIVAAGDLIVHPIPYFFDGYPGEWIQSLLSLSQLDADTIVPGHGPILHDKAYLFLLRDLLKSAVDQMNAKLKQSGPAMFRTLDEVKAAIDLTSFRQRFAGSDKDLDAAYDRMTDDLVKIVFEEASLR